MDLTKEELELVNMGLEAKVERLEDTITGLTNSIKEMSQKMVARDKETKDRLEALDKDAE
jgi:uncharacterized protein YlxW (UPF0749 family)